MPTQKTVRFEVGGDAVLPSTIVVPLMAPPSPTRSVKSIKSLRYLDNLTEVDNLAQEVFDGVDENGAGAEARDFPDANSCFSFGIFNYDENVSENPNKRKIDEALEEFGLPMGAFEPVKKTKTSPTYIDSDGFEDKWKFQGFKDVKREMGNFTYSCWSREPFHRPKKGLLTDELQRARIADLIKVSFEEGNILSQLLHEINDHVTLNGNEWVGEKSLLEKFGITNENGYKGILRRGKVFMFNDYAGPYVDPMRPQIFEKRHRNTLISRTKEIRVNPVYVKLLEEYFANPKNMETILKAQEHEK